MTISSTNERQKWSWKELTQKNRVRSKKVNPKTKKVQSNTGEKRARIAWKIIGNYTDMEDFNNNTKKELKNTAIRSICFLPENILYASTIFQIYIYQVRDVFYCFLLWRQIPIEWR